MDGLAQKPGDISSVAFPLEVQGRTSAPIPVHRTLSRQQLRSPPHRRPAGDHLGEFSLEVVVRIKTSGALISSSRFSNSAGIAKSNEAKLSSSCSILVAPIMVEDTCAGDRPISFATLTSSSAIVQLRSERSAANAGCSRTACSRPSPLSPPFR